MKLLTNGATRYVLLVGSWAIKVPYLKFGNYEYTGWIAFLNGLLANMQEAQFSATKDPRLCPVIFHVPGGFLNVMKRAHVSGVPISNRQYKQFQKGDFWVPVEHKADSFGFLEGRLVAVDYGS